jgi:molybdopterin-binding protein
VTHLRISEVAALLRVSDDTVRRWIDQGRLTASVGDSGRKVVDGAELARFVREQPVEGDGGRWQVSARNRLDGIVTDVRRDGLVAQVEIQAGPFRLVSLMTREAADELGLRAGSLAAAVVKATTVIVEAGPDRG